jgi:hypothetical protein
MATRDVRSRSFDCSVTRPKPPQIPLTAGTGIAGVSGSSQYQAQPGQRELQIEVEHLPRSPLIRRPQTFLMDEPLSNLGNDEQRGDEDRQLEELAQTCSPSVRTASLRLGCRAVAVSAA